MGKYIINLSHKAEQDLKKKHKSGGEPEALKHNLSGLWSRKINQKDRLIYQIKEEIVTVFVLSAIGHYNDK